MWHKIAQGVRRFRLGSPEAPVIPGMDVIDWRVDVLCHRDSRLHVVKFKQSCPDEKQIDEVELTKVFPSYKRPSSCYIARRAPKIRTIVVKKVQILDLVTAAQAPCGAWEVLPSALINHEASTRNRLMSQPHPNVVHFFGVQVNNEYIHKRKECNVHVPLAGLSVTGLAFKKDDSTLDELVIRRNEVDVKLCLKSVAAALHHLHKMGYVHGSLSPHHIWVTRGDDVNHFSLEDFAGAHKTGDVITFKTGENGWSKSKIPGIDQAQEADDWYAFRKLTQCLIKQTGEKMEDLADMEALTRR
jgi:serine/threonine protein kinase